MSIVIEPAALEATSRDLLRHDLRLGSTAARVLAPDTGGTSGLTADGIAAHLTRTSAVGDVLRALADGLEQAADLAYVVDGSVSSVLVAIAEGLAS